jgi:diguanylate cyclase (GGDEF)-like protein
VKILVVDDSSLVRSTVSRMVADLGHECEGAEDAAAAFARYNAFCPDMIISDWNMPGESGIDLCHRVRESDGGRYTYFAMLTSSGGCERLVAAMQAGADDFLVKPLRVDRLEAALLAAERITSLHTRLAASETRSRDLAEEQGAVVRIASAVAAGTDPGAVFADVAREAAHLCGASAGSLWRFQGTEATLAGSWGDEPFPLGATVTPSFDGTLGQVMGYGLSMRVDDAAGDSAAARSVAGAPVYLLGEVWGAVLVSTPAEAPLDTDAQDRVARFSEYVAVAVSNAEVRRRIEAQAVTDPLTQIANRRGFQERLAAEVSRAVRHRRALSMVLFDVDHFKRINDTYGHPAGDRVLVEVSRRIAAQIRDGELIARVGGEEFAWILPEATATGATVAAERARAAVCAEPIEGVGMVTVSAGISDIQQAEWVGDDLFRMADRALYSAKSQGRNRTVVAGSGEAVAAPVEIARPQADRTAAYSGLRALAEAVDLRVAHTWRHHERVAEIAVELGSQLGWTGERIGRLREASLLHDVGFSALVVGDDDAGEHARLGATMASLSLDAEQVSWIALHHTAFEESLPEGARILAVAEALDTLACDPERSLALSREEALAELEEQAGTRYCPRVIGVMTGTPPAPTPESKTRAA